MAETIYTRLEERLREAHNYLAKRGRLLGVDKLEEEYQSFRERFGPEKLAALSGPDLLEVMTPGGDHSLPDWLESEGKEEHQIFGYPRISTERGFGLWFDEAEQCWYRLTRPGEYLRGERTHTRLTLPEAQGLARDVWEQLLRAAHAVDALPEIAGDVLYLKLQDELEKLAPDLVGEEWLHKYLAVCFPDRLDQIHDPREQRHLLIKCLEMPPRADEVPAPGYCCGGRFSRMARELQMPMNHLCLTLSCRFGSIDRYWMLETSEKEWQQFTSQGFIDMGWPRVGDLTLHSLAEALRWDDMVRSKLKEHYPHADTDRVFAQLEWTARLTRYPDVIIAFQHDRVLGLAEVTSLYEYEPASDFPHRHTIRTLEADLSSLPQGALPEKPVFPLAANEAVRLAVEEALAEIELQ